MDMKPVKIGGELFWSNWMHQFNTKFNEDNKKYECTIGNLSDKAAEVLVSSKLINVFRVSLHRVVVPSRNLL